MGLFSNKTPVSGLRIIHHLNEKALSWFYEEYQPVFMVSTGRAGSQFFVHAVSELTDAAAYHEPRPNLMSYQNFAYHNQEQFTLLREIFHVARQEIIAEACIKNKAYVEGNQCISFFVPQVLSVFPRAKFIIVVRHPGAFIRSAIMKGFHKNDSIWEIGRVKAAEEQAWSEMDHVQKLAWTWQATYDYLHKAAKAIDQDQLKIVRFEDMTNQPGVLANLIRFSTGKKIDESDAAVMQKRKVNEVQIHSFEPKTMHKVKSYPAYADWSEADKLKVRKVCGNLSLQYDYVL